MSRAQGDRRSHVRFEVVGQFWGVFDGVEAVTVRNITRMGVLIESRYPLAVESIKSIVIVMDGQPARADARVLHERPTAKGNRHLIGLEFLAPSTVFIEIVERVIEYRKLRRDSQ